MKLKVPLVRQGKGTWDCGPACIAMLLKYYGIEASIEEINKELGRNSHYGMYISEIASCLLNKNLDVGIISFDPVLFLKKHQNVSSPELISYLEDEENFGKQYFHNLNFFESLVDFMKSGGSVKVKIPGIEDLTAELANNRPVFAALTTKFLHNKHGYNNHAYIITGLDDRFIYANDPGYENGGRVRYSINKFLFGLYASSDCGLITVKEDVWSLR